MNNSPVMIIGYPRSGTTLLYHIIMASNQFAQCYFTETHYFSHYYRRYGDLKQEENMKNFLKDIFSSKWYSQSKVDHGSFSRRIKNVTDYGQVFRNFMEALAESQGKPRWVEKTAWHMAYVREIRKAIPKVKLLYIIRDARDVALSVCRAGWSKGPFSGPVRVAISWHWYITRARKALLSEGHDFLPLRYEDLVVHPENEVGKINRFLGTKIDVNSLRNKSTGVFGRTNSSFQEEKFQSNTISSFAVERWKKKMSPETNAAIEALIGDSLQSQGYELISTFQTKALNKIGNKGLLLTFKLYKEILTKAYPIFGLQNIH